MTNESDSLGGTIALNCDGRAALLIAYNLREPVNSYEWTAREPEDGATRIQTSQGEAHER